MILAAAAAAAAEVLADSLIGDVVSSGEWLLLVARFPCSSSKNNNRNSNRNRNNNNNNRNQEDPAVFTESSAHHPLGWKSKISQVPSRWLQLVRAPCSVSAWVSEVVSVGIVMKGAQSDAKKWI